MGLRFIFMLTRNDRTVEDASSQLQTALRLGVRHIGFKDIGLPMAELQSLNAAIKVSGATTANVNDRIGEGLGRALDQILQTAKLERAIVAGGDTSGHALQAMGIYALTAIAPLASGAPLCRASSDREHAGIEIALKGGQVGGVDLFSVARDGNNRS